MEERDRERERERENAGWMDLARVNARGLHSVY